MLIKLAIPNWLWQLHYASEETVIAVLWDAAANCPVS